MNTFKIARRLDAISRSVETIFNTFDGNLNYNKYFKL